MKYARHLHSIILFTLSLVPCLLAIDQSATSNEAPLGVVSLTHDTFNEKLKAHNATLVEFFTPWCGYCKKLKPELEEAAKNLTHHNIVLHAVNCMEEQKLCDDLKIAGYPTLKVYKNGEFFSDSDERTAAGIVELLRRLNMPAITELTSETLGKFMKEELPIIGVFPSASHKLYNIFEELAEKHRLKFDFGRLVDKKAGQLLNLTSENEWKPTVVAIHGDEKEIYAGGDNITELYQFLFVQRLPVLGKIDHDNYEKYIDADLPMAYIFYLKEEDYQNLWHEFIAMAKAYRYNASLMFIDVFNKHDSHAFAMGLKENKFPAFSVHDIHRNRKYPMSQSMEFSPEAVKRHLDLVLSNSAKPYFSSEPKPDKQNGTIYTVVHDNFNEIILDTSKDALIQFYAPWCQACKQLAPIYEKLGELFHAQRDKVVIGKMKVEENDMPETVNIELRSIPALYFFTAKNNTMIKYDGTYTLDDLETFVIKNAANVITAEDVSAEESVHDEL